MSKRKLHYEPMQPYDGKGWLCWDTETSEGNVGFGDTKEEALASFERGEDIGEHAMAKWQSLGMI